LNSLPSSARDYSHGKSKLTLEASSQVSPIDWLQQRVIVTGGAGFLGSKVVAELRKRGCQKIFVPRSAEYDLRQPERIKEMLKVFPADQIIHLAANVGGIGANKSHPAEFFYDNASMGIHIIEEGRIAGVEKTTIIGTICSYPKFAQVPFKEDELWAGHPEETNAPYGLAKLMLLTQAQAYRLQYGTNVIYLMPVNLYGPGDNFDVESSHVIPALIRRFIEAQSNGSPHVEIWGSGNPTREFLYVDDAARSIVLAAERFNDPEPVNLGSGKEISIRDLASLIAQLTGFTGELVFNPKQPDGQPRRSLDTSRARESFGFTAETDFESGLRSTIDWWINEGSVDNNE
jgi:GDP-L-fucose synthase